MTQEDSVRRLAEIRERADKATPGPWRAEVGFISWEELGYDADALCCWQTAASAEDVARHPGFGTCAEPDDCEGHEAVPPRPALSMVEGPTRLNADADDGWYHTGEDAEFIAHSREDVPYLLSVIDSLTAERDRLRDEAMHASALLDGVGLCREHFPTTERGWLPCVKCGELAAEADRERLREALERLAIQAERHMKGPDGYYSIAAKARAALATPPSEGGQS